MLNGRAFKFSGRNYLLLMILLVFYLIGCAPASYESSSDVQSEIDDVEYLAGYGEWLEIPPYGMVWSPYVVSDWEPFYYGHWIWTNDGWAWTSYEPYGWLVFHYGYWGYQPGIGWFWVPEDVWWPARVQWYTFEDYIAWAPLPPPGIVWLDPWDPYDVAVWIVVDINRFTYENIGIYRIAGPIARNMVLRQTAGRKPPDIQLVERVSGKSVPMRQISRRVTNIHTQAVSAPSKSVQPRDSTLKRMVLPRKEKRKVEKHAPRVEREVLSPRKAAPERSREQPEKKTDTTRKRKKSP